MVKIIISKRTIYIIAVVFGILCLGVGVYAYGGTNPSVMGHSIGELASPSGTGVLMFSSGSWVYTTNLPLTCDPLDFLQYDSTTRTFSCGQY